LKRLRYDRLLSTPWQVVETDPALVLEPETSGGETHLLRRLQDDMRVIADTLEDIVSGEAATMHEILE
jgi:hypothetical protein